MATTQVKTSQNVRLFHSLLCWLALNRLIKILLPQRQGKTLLPQEEGFLKIHSRRRGIAQQHIRSMVARVCPRLLGLVPPEHTPEGCGRSTRVLWRVLVAAWYAVAPPPRSEARETTSSSDHKLPKAVSQRAQGSRPKSLTRVLSFEESKDQLDLHEVVDSGDLLFGLHSPRFGSSNGYQDMVKHVAAIGREEEMVAPLLASAWHTNPGEAMLQLWASPTRD